MPHASREEMEALDHISRVMDLDKAQMAAALKAEGEGLQLMEAHILRIVLAHEGCTQLDVVHETRRDKAQIGKLVATLVGRGLLSKAADPQDRRRQRLTLTARGEELARRSTAHRAAVAHLLFAETPPDELKQLVTLLQRLEASIAPSSPPRD